MYPELKRYFAFLNSTEWIGRSNQAVQADLNSVKPGDEQNLKGHVIICGYGPTGNIVAKKLQSTGLSVVIIDLNYKVIQSLKSSKQYAIYGDSSSSIVLEAAGLHNASLLIVTIPDPAAMRSLIKKVKKLHPSLPVVLRVKYMSDRDQLLSLGADDVVWEEYEAGVELSKRALERLNIQEIG